MSSRGTATDIKANRIGYYMGAKGERPLNWLERLGWHL